ncbi:MAG: protein kinase [Myxococcales bacterium]|nr:protein kinase [Myxococcales bacterium]
MDLPAHVILPAPGTVVGGKYTIDHLIGAGGMGAVFAATHRTLGHTVAIKVMFSDPLLPNSRARFLNEARAAANIRSDHVVRVSDVDEEDGFAYMILELLEGEDLADHLTRHRRLPPPRVAAFMTQALRGIGAAHALGVVHRDLKPANIFLTARSDGSPLVKVLDFGISKATGGALAAQPSMTNSQATLGSPRYMSPEQVRSSSTVTPLTDVWAVGVILYELVSGQRPFDGEDLGGLLAAILEKEPVPLRAVAPDVSTDFEAVVMRCLRKRPEERFQSAAEVIDALAPFITQDEANAPLSTPARPAPPATPPGLGEVSATSGQGFSTSTGDAPHSRRASPASRQRAKVVATGVLFGIAATASAFFAVRNLRPAPAVSPRAAAQAAPSESAERAASTAPTPSGATSGVDPIEVPVQTPALRASTDDATPMVPSSSSRKSRSVDSPGAVKKTKPRQVPTAAGSDNGSAVDPLRPDLR